SVTTSTIVRMRSWQDRPTDTFTENPARFSNIQTWDSRMTTHGISKPKARRRRMLGLAQAQAAVQVRGVEVVQCVQDLTNSVPLLPPKTTLVRVSLGPTPSSQPGQTTGEPAGSRSGGADPFPAEINSLRLNPWSPFTLQEQREDLDRSLNFRLPAAATAAGQLNLRISRIFQPGGADLPVAQPNIAPVTFSPASSCRC